MHVTGFPTFALFDNPPGARFNPLGRHLEPVGARRACPGLCRGLFRNALTFKIEHFVYLNKYQILICKKYAYRIPLNYVTSYLKCHLHKVRRLKNRAALSALEKQLRYLSLVNPLKKSVVFPDPNKLLLPEVPLHNSFR